MDPAIKIALSLCVLLAGVFAAALFRREPPQPGPNAENDVLLRCRVDSPALDLGRRAPGRNAPIRQGATPANSRAPTVVTPVDRREPPPSLAPDYPESARPASSRWGVSMDMMLPSAAPADETARTHKVVDGDTLAALADRYLGSSARAGEIYDANRDALRDPRLLPIGLELKLPPRNGPRPPKPVR